MATGTGDVVARGGQEAPETVELCVRNRDGFPCLGVIHRLEPDGRIYCTRCGGNARGAIYVKREADAALAPGIDSFNSPD